MIKLVKISPIYLISFFILNSISFSQTQNNINYIVAIYDSVTANPIGDVKINIFQNNAIIASEITKSSGTAFFTLSKEGNYKIEINAIGYNEKDTNIYISSSRKSSFFLNLPAYSTEEIEVVGKQNITSTNEINSISGAQIYNIDATSVAPSSRITNIISKNFAGAIVSPTGQVFIRGDDSGLEYIIDGMVIPAGVVGGLNEMVDPKVIDKIKFQTGGFPAEYGGVRSALVDIQNRIPPGKFHLDFSTFGGSFFVFNGAKMFNRGKNIPIGQSSNAPGDTLGGSVGPFRTLNSNGQSLSLSGHISNTIGYFITGSRQETDRRIDQPAVTLYNDYGKDYLFYGKFSINLGKNDYATVNLNYGNTNTQIPFNIITQGYAPDVEKGFNSFQTISYMHQFSSRKNNQDRIFIGLIGRQSGLSYMPSSLSPANFTFQGDSNKYALTSNLKFQTYGIKTKYEVTVSKYFSAYTGFDFLTIQGTSNFSSRDSLGNAGPSDNNNVKGSDLGSYVETEIRPIKPINFDLGLRYDQHISPTSGKTYQFSPRLKLNFFIDKSNSGYLYFGKLFVAPTLQQDLRGISSNTTITGIPTVPERDNFYEAVFIHNFNFGLIAKLSAYYKDVKNFLDDQTIGSSSLLTKVNESYAKITGIEIALNYRHLKLPLSGFLNVALAHGYWYGFVTGGYLLPLYNSYSSGTDFDHDQRLTISSGITWHPNNWFVNFTGNYGSGLMNGNPNNVPVKLGLFDFNSGAHVKPWKVFNLGGGYTFRFKEGFSTQLSIYINNLFDESYIIKGTFYDLGNLSYGERRNVQLKVEFHI